MLDTLFDGFSLNALWQNVRNGITQLSFLGHLLLTVFVVIIAIVISRVIARYYRRRGDIATPGARRVAYLAARNAVAGVTAMLLIFIWAGELRTFALSVAALAAAVAIVCKEFFMNGLGSLMRAIARPYIIGDVIEITHMKGEVLEIDFLTTRLLEEGPSGYVTGRTYEFPNMMLLTNPVRKLSHTGRYVHELVRIPVDPGEDIGLVRQLLLQAGESVCEEWIEAAAEHFRRLESARLIALPDSRPVVLLEPIDPKRVDVVLRFPCQAGRRVSTSQDILQAFYELALAEGLVTPTRAAARAPKTPPVSTEPVSR